MVDEGHARKKAKEKEKKKARQDNGTQGTERQGKTKQDKIRDKT